MGYLLFTTISTGAGFLPSCFPHSDQTSKHLAFDIHAKPSRVCLNTNSSPTSGGASPCLRKDPILVFWALNRRQTFPRWIYLEDRAQPWNFIRSWGLEAWDRNPCKAEMGALMGQIKKHSLKEQLWQLASTTSTVAPLRVARLGWLPRQANLCKFTTAWWLASHLKNMPLAMKCHINSHKSHIFPKTNLDRLRQTGRYLQLRSFTFVALHDHYSGSF